MTFVPEKTGECDLCSADDVPLRMTRDSRHGEHHACEICWGTPYLQGSENIQRGLNYGLNIIRKDIRAMHRDFDILGQSHAAISRMVSDIKNRTGA